MRLQIGKERVIVRGIRPEEQMWGPYQFPRPFYTDDGIVVALHVVSDDFDTYGAENRWFETKDGGETWSEVSSEIEKKCGLLLQNGDRIYFPPASAFPLVGYKRPNQNYRTPGTDMHARAEEGTLPFPDGIRADGALAYNADRLPPSLSKKEWRMFRLKKGAQQAEEEFVPLQWPFCTRVVHPQKNGPDLMKALFPRGEPKIGPDGAIWVTAFSGEGHIIPKNGQYSPYYSAELFRSDDMGRTFHRRGHLEYPADGDEYPYLSGGFSDSDIEFMPDGSIIWICRSNWYGTTGLEWSPLYIARSTDMGHTWSMPKVFSDIGTLPYLLTFDCGATVICYARPGMYLRMTTDPSGLVWDEPIELMTPGDRSHLHNIPVEQPTFHEWVGSCNNPEMIKLDERSFLIFYTDFYYPDEAGVKRKTLLCRKVEIVP